jgi:hypothetical protein
MIGTDALLNLAPYVGQRSATFRFGLMNAVTGKILPDLNPLRDTVPTLSHDTTRTIKRQVTGLTLGVTDTARINSVQDRVTLFMGLAGVEYPLGRYVFSDESALVTTAGDLGNYMLLDEMYVIDQEIEKSISSHTASGEQGVSPLLTQILDPLLVHYIIEPSQYGTIGTWPIGTNRGNVLEDLALDGDYQSPWFDNDGIMRFIRTFDPAAVTPTFDWDANQVVIRDTPIRTSDLLSAPNRFIVISNSTSEGGQSQVAVVGVYDVPASAPWSIANRGFVVPRTVTLTVNSLTQANAIAANLGQRQTVFERYEISTAPDPRHDSYDVVRWQEQNWLELAWSLPLIEGSTMSHTIRRTFT